jgi:hypothetical protein
MTTSLAFPTGRRRDPTTIWVRNVSVVAVAAAAAVVVAAAAEAAAEAAASALIP